MFAPHAAESIAAKVGTTFGTSGESLSLVDKNHADARAKLSRDADRVSSIRRTVRAGERFLRGAFVLGAPSPSADGARTRREFPTPLERSRALTGQRANARVADFRAVVR